MARLAAAAGAAYKDVFREIHGFEHHVRRAIPVRIWRALFSVLKLSVFETVESLSFK